MAPLRRELLALFRLANDQTLKPEPLGQRRGDPQEELRAPSGADDRETVGCHSISSEHLLTPLAHGWGRLSRSAGALSPHSSYRLRRAPPSARAIRRPALRSQHSARGRRKRRNHERPCPIRQVTEV